jgi:mono/diheme cytochrome c family protein
MNKQTEARACLAVVGALCFFSIVAVGTRVIAREATASPAADAATIFNSKCAKCHGRDGRGKTMRGRLTHARDLTYGSWQNDVTDERLFNSISNGKGKMPAFKKSLSDADIDALVSHVRRLRR